MNTRKFAGLIAAVLLITSNSYAADAGLVEGKKLYRRHCGQCNGGSMRFMDDVNLERFNSALKRGIGVMPPMGKALTESEIDALWQYVSTTLNGKA
jgi:mono/diheme cytochrome c family protein